MEKIDAWFFSEAKKKEAVSVSCGSGGIAFVWKWLFILHFT